MWPRRTAWTATALKRDRFIYNNKNMRKGKTSVSQRHTTAAVSLVLLAVVRVRHAGREDATGGCQVASAPSGPWWCWGYRYTTASSSAPRRSFTLTNSARTGSFTVTLSHCRGGGQQKAAEHKHVAALFLSKCTWLADDDSPLPQVEQSSFKTTDELSLRLQHQQNNRKVVSNFLN